MRRMVLGMVVAGLSACGGGDDDGASGTDGGVGMNTCEVFVPDPTTDCITLHLENQSSSAFRGLYITDVGSDTWGPNILGDGLGDNILQPGEPMSIPSVCCQQHDVLLVDLDDAQCGLCGIQLCEEWFIVDDTCRP